MRMQASDAMVSYIPACILAWPLIIVCYDSFQFHRPALLVTSLSWMGGMGWKGEWRCAEVGCGEQFMISMDGISMMHMSHANN